MLNKVFIVGRLTKDPVVRYTPQGTPVSEFSIAYNRRYRSGDEWKEESHFFDIKAWGKLADRVVSQISKGYLVIVEGSLIQERWTSKEGTQQSKVRILADSVKLISKPGDQVSSISDKIIEEEEEIDPLKEIENDINSHLKDDLDDELPF